MSRMYRVLLSAFALVIALGTADAARAEMQCFHQENSHEAYDQRYGYYCIGTGAGCSFCYDIVIVNG